MNVAKAFENAFSHDISVSKHATGDSRMMVPTRREIFQYLCEFPCSSISEISRSINRSPPTVEWHLRKLFEDRYISSKIIAEKVLYYPLGLIKENDLALIEYLNMKSARTVLDYIIRNPGTTQKEIASYLGMGSAYVCKITKKLTALNLVVVIIDGRFRRYYPSDFLREFKRSNCERVKGFKRNLLDRLAYEGMNPELVRSSNHEMTIRVSQGKANAMLNLACARHLHLLG